MDQPSGNWTSTDIAEPQSPPLAVVSSLPSTAPVVLAASRTSAPNGGSSRVDAPPPQKTDEVKTGFWLTHADQIVLALLAAITLALLAAYWVRSSKWNTAPIEIEHLERQQFDFKIDINSATWVEWNQLDGVGDSLAHRIVDDREQNGPFHSIDDLRRVKGIGPKTLEKLRPWLSVDATQAESPP